MQEILDGLEKWRINRNMNAKGFVRYVEMSNLLEECKEYVDAECEYDTIDSLCDISVFSLNAIHYICNSGSVNASLTVYLIDSCAVDSGDIAGIVHRISVILSDDDIHIPLIKLIEINHMARIMIGELGYDYEKCMLETIKEISSRLQDPEQEKDWIANGASGKWRKDPNQLESTKYKANYEACRL